ncbi:hypothetical protein BDZ94DRAFT_1252318 [Collybia nuda]|uniref:Uncharacterized protein n=1 Tax=Collybia nuda TaxID=64659 RepID=A0A9P6CH94_9AGAR|nr:hypothetical protein BDZ94DRAFT_1252318 [Collybia nuda]
MGSAMWGRMARHVELNTQTWLLSFFSLVVNGRLVILIQILEVDRRSLNKNFPLWRCSTRMSEGFFDSNNHETVRVRPEFLHVATMLIVSC